MNILFKIKIMNEFLPYLELGTERILTCLGVIN